MEFIEEQVGTVAAIEDLIGRLPFVERVQAELPVWQLRYRGFGVRDRALEAEKIQTLEVLGVASLSAFLAYSEDPVVDEVPGQWERVAGDTWRVPADADLAAMVSWLHLGGWMLYSADTLVESAKLFSIGFAPEAKLIAQMVEQLSLHFLIVSFHDDVSWTIAAGSSGVR